MLQLCPNLTSLNLSFTNIGDNSFRGVRLDKLEELNCEGCENLSDNAFKHLLMSNIAYKNNYKSKNESQQCKQNPTTCDSIENIERLQDSLELVTVNNSNDNREKCQQCTRLNNIEDLSIEEDKHDNDSNAAINSLKSINLSGCWSITDYGLSYIASKYDLRNLQYLNLSGCVNMTSLGMNLFVEMSSLLDGENLYYCDNITDGPLSNMANGCENLEQGRKFCCRSGQ